MNEVVRLLFQELADRSRSERESVFRDRQIPPDLRAAVESLLSFDSQSEHGLTNCASSVAAEALSSGDQPQVSQCGPYRLGMQLSSRGRGNGYLTAGSDGERPHYVAA